MESNNIVTAPQVADTDAAFGRWKQAHAGSLEDFYAFMTTPTQARDEFLTLCDTKTMFNGSVAALTIFPG